MRKIIHQVPGIIELIHLMVIKMDILFRVQSNTILTGLKFRNTCMKIYERFIALSLRIIV